MGDRYYSTSTAFLEALAEAGIRYMFANLGSDHPGLIEALARARAEGRRAELPELIVCPHETVALSAAHAYAAVSGEPQAVLVHVDAGTQNLGGADRCPGQPAAAPAAGAGDCGERFPSYRDVKGTRRCWVAGGWRGGGEDGAGVDRMWVLAPGWIGGG